MVQAVEGKAGGITNRNADGGNETSSRRIELFLLLQIRDLPDVLVVGNAAISSECWASPVVASTTVSAATQQVRRNFNHAVKYLLSETARSTDRY